MPAGEKLKITMTVHELIVALQECDQDATVLTRSHQHMAWEAARVRESNGGFETEVHIDDYDDPKWKRKVWFERQGNAPIVLIS